MPHGPITERILRAARRAQSSKVADLAAYRAGGEIVRELNASVANKVGDLDPVHGFWSIVQHNLAMFVEQVLGLPEADRIARLIAAAEEEYMPKGPPMSPLTGTYPPPRKHDRRHPGVCGAGGVPRNPRRTLAGARAPCAGCGASKSGFYDPLRAPLPTFRRSEDSP